MAIEILMPALSPTMETGTLAKWLVKEGDKVAAGDVIAEIETDKATMEVEAVDEGIIGRIVVAEGTEDVAVNQPIALLVEEGEEAGALKAAAPAPEKKQEAAKPSGPEAAGSGKGAPRSPQPSPQRGEGAGLAVPQTPLHTSPLGGEVGMRSMPGEGALSSRGTRVFASPLAKRLAGERGIDLASVSGSGPRGRIVKRDVDEAVPGAPAAVAPAPGPGDAEIAALYAPGSYTELPHDGMRKTIARRLVESKRNIPHYYLTVDCQLDALAKLRKELNAAASKDAEGNPEYKLSVNDFLIKALALALHKVPMANATWTETARLIHTNSDVGVAVAVPDGLFTPVIRQAESKTLSAISAEMRDLAGRARSKKLKPEEYQGGTTSLSNLGMYGVKEFTAVINPPHATILAVGAGVEQPVVKSGRIVVATVMTATLSCDHRVVDGVLGAELLAAFKSYVEKPMGMLV